MRMIPVLHTYKCHTLKIAAVVAAILYFACPVQALTLAWDAVVDPNLAGYNVYRATDRGLWQMTLLNTGGPIQAASYADSNAVVGQLYFYVVRSVAKDGSESATSNELAIIAPVPRPDPIPVPSGDTQPPVILSVNYSGGGSVLGNTAKIQANAFGVPFTVTVSDNVGVVYTKLYVDGQLGPEEHAYGGSFGAYYYIRWNASSVGPGRHTFRLVIQDAAGNQAERSWSMSK